MSTYEMPKMEVPVQFREMTDKGLAHVRNTCEKAKVASEEAADLLAVPILALPLTTLTSCWG
jgi:hypothetical protein